MVTMTNGQAQVALGALRELAALLLPPAGALRIRKTMRQLAEHLQDVEAERQKLLDEYAQKDDHGRVLTRGEDGKPVAGGTGPVVFVSAEAEAAANAAYAELMAAEWSTEYPVRVSDLGTSAPMRAETLLQLGDLLEDG